MSGGERLLQDEQEKENQLPGVVREKHYGRSILDNA
jgi:hypothetical protein